MRRRTFLLRSAAAALAVRPLAHAATSPRPAPGPIPAIDTHIHLYDPARPQGVPWPPKTDALLHRPFLPADFRRTVAPFQVVGTVVVEASEWVEDNQWILDLAADAPEIVGFVGNLRPGNPDFAASLRRFAAHPLFRGLRLRAADVRNSAEPAIAADLRRVADAGLSIDVIGGPAILAPTVALAQQFPSLRLVIDHLPFKDWDGQATAMGEALAAAATLPNIALKVSELVRRVQGSVVTDPDFYRPGLDLLLARFGPDRLLFGSNWPVSERVAPYAAVHRCVAEYFASQPRAVAENYFWRNSLAVYRWLPRGAAAALVR